MIYLTNEQILDLMKSCVCFAYRKDGKEGNLCCEINFSTEEGVTMGAYQAFLEEELIFETEEYDEMLAFLQANEFEIFNMNDFESFEEYQADREFQRIDMKSLLEKYADCDRFSLSGLYGKNYLPKEEGERICREIQARNKRYLEALYLNFQDEGLPPFEVLYEEISLECQAYKQKREKRKKHFYCSFIADEVGDTTRYSEPMDYFWHFYHTLGTELDNLRHVQELAALPERWTPTEVLEEEEYALLKPYLLKTNISFQTHCTTCGLMQKELFFVLNEETKKWLLQRKNDYDFDGALQDLAFYKGDKLRFSSCTHEGYHDDIE